MGAPPLSFLAKAVVLGLGGVMAAPVMILGPIGAVYVARKYGEPVDPGSLVFLVAGLTILAIAIRALRRGGDDGWRPGPWLRRALVPCLVLGVAGAIYAVVRLDRGRRFLVERDARYLCELAGRTDGRCIELATRCRRLNGGLASAAETERDADCLACLADTR